MIPIDEEGVRPSDRYVLVKARSDGTPTTVRPMPNLEAAREHLRVLNEQERGWHVYDVVEGRLINRAET